MKRFDGVTYFVLGNSKSFNSYEEASIYRRNLHLSRPIVELLSREKTEQLLSSQGEYSRTWDVTNEGQTLRRELGLEGHVSQLASSIPYRRHLEQLRQKSGLTLRSRVRIWFRKLWVEWLL